MFRFLLSKAAAPRSNAVLAVGLFALMTAAGIIARPLLPIDETRYLTVAWEMWQSGDYLVPHLNGQIYSQKPPMLFWLINLTWALFGLSETMARLVGPVFAAASIIMTYVLARTMWPQHRHLGGRAALVLATIGVFALYGSLVMFDALLTATVLVTLLAMIRAYQTGHTAWWFVCGIGIGLGVLSKGPVILVHVLPVALLMPLWADRACRPSLHRWYGGIALSLVVGFAVVAIWLVPALIEGGAEYRQAILWRQTAGRVVGSFAHRRPFWYFLALLPLITWPWLWWPPIWRDLRKNLSFADPMIRFCATWLATTFVIFTLISGKQIHYLLPLLPAVALLVAHALEQPVRQRRWAIVPFLPVILLSAAIALAAFGRLNASDLIGIDIRVPASAMGLVVLAYFLPFLWVIAKRWWVVVLATPVSLGLAYFLGMGVVGELYDGNPLAAAFARSQQTGLAFAGSSYQGEFGFLGRLGVPVEQLRDAAEITAWAGANPAGTIIGRTDRVHPGWAPTDTRNYRGARYGVWVVGP